MTEPGSLIASRYRLGNMVGSGAMGVVWEATDERLHRTVAVKQMKLPPGLSSAEAEGARARVMREGRIAARVSHPCAISIYDVIEHSGAPWLVMEYLPSRSLAGWLTQHGPLAPSDAALVGASVAQALTAAHEAGVVHRDVKPANILLGDDGTVKITDFGISRATDDVTLTATGVLAGTPAYLSPEMARGDAPAPPSDVFSLGSTLYAAVEGKPPFGTRDNQLAMLHAVSAGHFDPPQHAGKLTALLMRLMRADPAQRPTMAEAGRALNQVAGGEPVQENALLPELYTPRTHQQYPQAIAQQAPAAPQYPETTAQPVSPQYPPQYSATSAQPRPQQYPARPPRDPGSAGRRTTAAKTSPRSIILSVIAVIAAAAVGVGVASLLMDNASSAAPMTAQTTSQANVHAGTENGCLVI